MKAPTLKHRKPIVYISLGIYALLTILIIAESCMGSSLSGSQSDFIASISAFFVNLIKGPQVVETYAPNKIDSVYDSTFLGQDEDGYSNIVVGTTTLLSVGVTFPEKGSNDVYDKTYTVNKVKGNEDNYNLVISTHESNVSNVLTYYVDVRIVANTLDDDLYQIEINFANSLSYTFDFKIVDLQKPVNYEMKVDKTNLKQGESAIISTKLIDDNRDDWYLRRYYDQYLLDYSSSDESIIKVDKYGVIHAVGVGSATAFYGTNSFDITVTNYTLPFPIEDEINLAIDETSNPNPSVLDYDYVFNVDDNSNDYSSLIVATHSNNELLDKSISFELSDDIKAKLAPYKYDEDGYPIYYDDNNNPCVRVCGYRQKGDVILNAYSNMDNNITSNKTLSVGEALAESMNVNVNNNVEIITNDQIRISATFSPKNTFNTAIRVTTSDDNIASISSNNTSSPIITGNAQGECTITITSLSNESLNKTFNLKVKIKKAIDDDNFTDFASFMRKFAGHFSLFLLTAVFAMIFYYTYIDDFKKLWLTSLLTLGSGFITAGISELIQLFVPTRSGVWLDVGIDFLGFIIGAGITLLIILLIRFIVNKKKAKKEEQ